MNIKNNKVSKKIYVALSIIAVTVITGYATLALKEIIDVNALFGGILFEELIFLGLGVGFITVLTLISVKVDNLYYQLANQENDLLKEETPYLELCEESLNNYSHISRKEHPNLIDFYNYLGFIYTKKGDKTKAAKYYEKAFYIQLKTHGNGHPDTINSYFNIIRNSA